MAPLRGVVEAAGAGSLFAEVVSGEAGALFGAAASDGEGERISGDAAGAEIEGEEALSQAASGPMERAVRATRPRWRRRRVIMISLQERPADAAPFHLRTGAAC
jgi:hypothetical protein